MTSADGDKTPRGGAGANAARRFVLFTEGPIRRHIIRMAVPMTWGILATVAAALADTWFLAQLGTAHLAAITFTFPVAMLIMSLTMGIASGFASLLARALGQGNMGLVENLTISAMLLAAVLVAVLSTLGFFTIDPLFTAMGAGPQTLPLIKDFMSIWYLTMIFVVAPLIGNFALRATGNPRAASMVMITGALVNVALDPLFIFGFWFIPAMGIKGAALAGVLARFTSFVVTFYILIWRSRLMTFKWPGASVVFDAWRGILKIGGPLALTNMVAPVSTAFVTFLLAGYGQSVVAGFGIAARIEGLVIIPLMALGSSLGPISGQNFGAAKYDRIVELFVEGFRFVALYTVACAIFLALFHNVIPAIFDQDRDVIHIAGLYLLAVPVGYIGMGIAMVVGSSFTGMGNPKPSVMMSLARLSVVYVPLAIFGNWLFGPVGIFAANALANLLVAAGALVYVGYRLRLAGAEGQIEATSMRQLVSKRKG